MAITPVPPVTATPAFPALSDRAAGTYNSMAYAFGTHMPTFKNENVAVADSAVQNAGHAEAQAQAAAASAGMAATAVETVEYTSGVSGWVSGKVYQKLEAAISQINAQVYRRTVAGSGTVDPANDTNGTWVLRAGAGSFVPQQVAGTSINLSRGNDFFKALNGSETLTFDNCPQDGYSFTLEVEVTSGMLTLPSSVRTPANTAYILSAGKVHLLFFRTRNRGARWRMTAAPNYDI